MESMPVTLYVRRDFADVIKDYEMTILVGFKMPSLMSLEEGYTGRYYHGEEERAM